MQSPPANRWLVLFAIMLSFLPIAVDMTILHIAIPSLTLALHATGTEILWIIDIYPLLMAGLLVPMGTLADRTGHRRMLLIGLLIFMVASALAAYAPSAMALIAARALLAFGAAMVIPCVLALIRQTFTDARERAIALGLWSTVGSAGAALGPLVGGVLLEHFWWGSVFLVNVPLILIIWPMVYRLLPRRAITGSGRWTLTQALVLIAGLMTSVYAVKSLFKPGVSLAVSGLLLGVGILLLLWFGRKQLTAEHPMLDLSLFAKPAIRAGLIMALVVSGALAGVELTIAQELQFVIGKTPLQAGIFMLPLILASAVGGPLAGYMVAYTRLRLVASCSLLISALSLAGLGFSDFHNSGPLLTLMLITLGLALSIGLMASSIAIMGSAPPEKAGAAGALEATGYDLGAGLGITGLGLMLASSYKNALQIPADIAAGLPAGASQSIGETMMAANALGGSGGEALAHAGQQAFISAHATVLLFAAALIAALSVLVYAALRDYKDPQKNTHKHA